MYQLGLKDSGVCLSYRDTNKPPEQTGSEPAVQRVISHTFIHSLIHVRTHSLTHTHARAREYRDTTQRVNFRRLPRPRVPEMP